MASKDVNIGGLSERSDSNEGWFQDVAANLDTYVRLSMAGLYDSAAWYFDDLLNAQDAEFPVTVSYTHLTLPTIYSV